MTKVTSAITIGDAVRRARRAAGLRQDELAGLAGVGTRFLGDLENGKPTVQLDKLLAVARTLGMDLHLDGHHE